MPVYTPPTRDMAFLLHDVMNVSSSDTPGYADLDPEFTEAVLTEAGKIAAEVFQPLNAIGDAEGCVLENGVVRTPKGFAEAFDQVRQGGWLGLDASPDFGGQGLPHVISNAVGEMLSAANMALQMYSGLTHGAASAIYAHGSDDQKATYLPNMYSGAWTGTMNLTEPHCGTDLGLIRTKADPQDDGSYRVTGTKIFISAGDHDLADNIIHLVLAKVPGGPEGVKGISLFIVPKFLVGDDGGPGQRNGVSVGGLEKKMGIHGNSTCVMNYDAATGFLLGNLHDGLRAMFTMMNEARLSVALQGYAQGDAAYQNALAFARERLQGRDVTGVKNPDGPADPIIVHPDVRRNLLDQKSFVEGARAFAFWGASLLDAAALKEDAEAEAMISLLTPVLKGFLTDKGFDTCVAAQQTLGGSGYIREWGVEQFVRDSRIAMIYEGTNGVQALDLVGRKLPKNGGKAMRAFGKMVKTYCADHKKHALARDFIEPLKAASKDLSAAVLYFVMNGMKDPNNALAGSYDFMHLFGHVCMGLMWTKMAVAAQAALDAGTTETDFYATKIATGRYYMARQLPATKTHLARIESGAKPVMLLDAANF